MTVTQDPQQTGWTSVNDAPTDRAPLWRRPTVVAGVAVLALAVTGVAFQQYRHPGPTAAPTAPAVLPNSMDGMQVADSATAQSLQDAFDTKAQKLGDVTVTGRTYASKDARRRVKVVIGRTDLTKKLDLAWVVDKGKKQGDASCSQKLKLTKDTEPRVRPTVMLCWRTSEHLSAYALIIDLDKNPTAKEGAAYVQQAWDAA